MEGNAVIGSALGWLEQVRALAQAWLLSPAAWSQFALLLVAWGAAVRANRMLQPRLTAFLTHPGTRQPSSPASGVLC